MRKVEFTPWIPVEYEYGEIKKGTNCMGEKFSAKGYFHTWGNDNDGFENQVTAIVELSDGTLENVLPCNMRFTEPYQEPVKEEPVKLYDADIEKLDWNVGDKVRYNGLNLIAVKENKLGGCSDCAILEKTKINCKFASRCYEVNTVFIQI